MKGNFVGQRLTLLSASVSAVAMLSAGPATAQTVTPVADQSPTVPSSSENAPIGPQSTAIPNGQASTSDQDSAANPAPPTPNTPTDQSADGLADIVVTANKRSENLQRTPLSITAISGDALASRGIVDPGQLVGLAPAVQFQPSFLLLTYIRGVGNYSSQPAVDQSIAYNVDSIYIDRPYSMPALLFDLERIELLRGPQGTLQGRNSTGGSVDLITARPTYDTFKGKLSVTAGNYGTINTEAAINIPIGSDLAVRVSAAQNHHNAYFDNGFGDLDSQGVRIKIAARPTSRLDIVLTGEYTQQREKGPTISICPPGSADAACQGVKWRPFSGVVGQGTDPVNSFVSEQELKTRNYALYGQINYDLDFATLTWVPNYRFETYRSNQIYSHFFGYAPAVRDSMHSQELRLSSNPGSPFTWVVGGYYGRQQSKEQNYFTRGDAPFITVKQPGFSEITNVYYKNDVDRYVYRSTSIFGQVTVPLLVDGFRVVAGGRYTWDRKTLRGTTGLVNAGPTLVSSPVGGSQSLSRFTYKAGLEYDLGPQVLTYANISTGFKSGGVNGLPPGTTNLPSTFRPEKNTAQQIGIKSRFFDNRVQINAEAFHYNYTGFLVSSFAVAPPGVLIGININSQKARMYGGEIESTFLLTPQDKFDLSVALLSARYVTFDVPAAGLNLSGKRLQNAPGHTFTFDYTHTWPLENGGNVQVHGNAQYQSNQYVDYRLSPGSFVSGFWRENADITYHSPDDRYTIGGFISNISNNGSPSVAIGGLGLYQLAVPYPPRTVGARVSAKF